MCDEEREEFIENLDNLIKALRENIRILVYTVDSISRANRMFQVVNDRGKDVGTADKIKSYINYYLAHREKQRESIDSLREETNKTFYKIYNHLSTKVTDEDVDSMMEKYISETWRLFTGNADTNLGDVYNDFKSNLDRQMSLNDRGRKFIQAYLETLRSNLKYFVYTEYGPDLILDSNERPIRENREEIYH